MGGLGVIMIVLAVIWFVLGIFVCQKHLWATYAISGMSGLSILGNLMAGNFPGIFGAGILLAESLIIGQKGRALQREGIPLDSLP